MTAVEIENVSVSYGSLRAVEDLSLSVGDGELVCLLGPSGCGKSTTLRAVAGFERPDTGRIRIDGVDVTDRPPQARDCSMVFQDWALFPNKTVLGNVAFGPRMDGAADARERAVEALDTVEMADEADSRPAELSGGQRQRVALARSLAADPDVLLLDEPLSNLDRRLREDVQLEIKRIQERLSTPMLYVTHDQDEAFTLADRIGVMDGGELVQVGRPREVYDRPETRFVEEFLGSTNLLDGAVVAVDDDGRPVVETAGTRVPGPAGTDLAVGDRVTLSVRPEVVTTAVPATDGGDPAGATARPGTDGVDGDRVVVGGAVEDVVYRGSRLRYYVSVGGRRLFVEESVTTAPAVEPGEEMELSWRPADAVLFDAAGARVE